VSHALDAKRRRRNRAAKIVSGDDASHLDDASKKALAETVNAMRRYFRA